MDKVLHTQLTNVLKTEAKYVMDNEKDINNKMDKINTIFNLKRIIDNYDELQPVLRKYFAEKAAKEKWSGKNELE